MAANHYPVRANKLDIDLRQAVVYGFEHLLHPVGALRLAADPLQLLPVKLHLHAVRRHPDFPLKLQSE